MKGLLIKDFKLMKCQRNFLILIAVIAVGMAASTQDSSFIIGYMTFVGSLFTLSTISYDEFDNGNTFLFSLPITRNDYVFEKYGFGLICGACSWLFGTLTVIIANVTKNNTPVSDIWVAALMILPIMIFLSAVMIPFQLKFGGEKGRIAIIGSVGLIFIICVIAVKIASFFNIDLIARFNNLPAISINMFSAILIIIAVIVLVISCKISMTIMSKKEF